MMNTAGLEMTKERIMSHIKEKGPSLPATIASEIRVQPLFVSAFLSELYREEKLLMSHLKVGTSSLYLIPGQEKMLENFIQHLNTREKEAFHLIKQKKFVKDSELTPVLRVAIREIKDFAKPEHNGTEIQWSYVFMEESDKENTVQQAVKTVKENIEMIQQNAIKIKEIEEIKETPEQEVKVERKEKPKKLKEKKVEPEENNFSLSLTSAQQSISTPFADEVKQFLEQNNYSSISTIKADKKESIHKATIQGPHGPQVYLIIAKDKKKIKEEELQAALQEAHSQRLLCLVLARGELDKKTSQFVSNWTNFLSYKTL